MLRGLRFFELFRRSRRYEERLSALQLSFDSIEPQPGRTPSAAPGQHHADDARAELLIGLNDDLDKMRQARKPRFAAIPIGVAGIFAFLNATNPRGAVLGALILVLALGVGWFELRRLRRVRVLQRVIERELSRPMPKASLPQPSHGSSGDTS